MKNLIAILFLFSLTLAAVTIPASQAKAQTTLTQTDPSGATSTINTNGDTSYHTITLAGSNNNFVSLNFVLAGVKNTGTISGGSAIMYGSMDGTNWYHLTPSRGSDTVTLTNANTNAYWQFDPPAGGGTASNWLKYRLVVITTGTQTSTYTVRLLGRKVAN